MTNPVSYLCAWNGLSPDGDGRVFNCDRPAVGYVPSPGGHRIYACLEHIAWAKRQGASGLFVNSVFEADSAPPIVQHASVRQARHRSVAIGAMY